MGAFNRNQVDELHTLWDKPRIDGKSLFAHRSVSERIDILRQLNLNGTEVLKSSELPQSGIQYVPIFCYINGVLSCETSEDYQAEGLFIDKQFYKNPSANLLPQFVEIA